MKTIKYFTLPVLLALTLLLSACGSPQPAALSDEEVTVLTVNLLTAMQAGDYPAFSRDLSESMLVAFPEEQFLQLSEMIASTSGEYISIAAPALVNQQGYAIYQFVCEYSQEDVVVTVSFEIDGERVEGLFFNSPNLLKQQQ